MTPALYIKNSRDLDTAFLTAALHQKVLVCYDPSKKGTQTLTSTVLNAIYYCQCYREREGSVDNHMSFHMPVMLHCTASDRPPDPTHRGLTPFFVRLFI